MSNAIAKPILCWEGKDDTICRSERLYQQELLEPLKQAQQFVDIGAKKKKEVCAYTYNSWHNRMMLGDSLSIMRSLLDNDNLGGKVQMIYFDPPYGISFKSGFSPFNTNNLGTKENIEAYRDVWKNGISSYLTYIRDRIILAHQLLDDTGSIFIQISDDNVHHIREICDEVFGSENYCGQIIYTKTGGLKTKLLSSPCDYIIWYAKTKENVKYRQLYLPKTRDMGALKTYTYLSFPDGSKRCMTKSETDNPSLIPKEARIYRADNLTSPGNKILPYVIDGHTYYGGWKTTVPNGMDTLLKNGRIHVAKNSIMYVRYIDDFNYVPLTLKWDDTSSGFTNDKIYVVQSGIKAVQRCLLMSTDPGDLVLDISCGSGTTAYVAEQWGRRWLTCDTSSVALALAKQRLMTATFDYYTLAHPEKGIADGLVYKTAPHITLGSIANGEEPPYETLYDQPEIDKTRVRVSGTFSYETMQKNYS